MQKNILVSLTATATAFSMIVAPGITAFAQDTQVIVGPTDASVTVESITVDNGQTAINSTNNVVTVTGDVTSSGNDGTQYSVSYTDGPKTYSNSDNAVIANNSNITIEGSLNANGDDQKGIVANDSKVTVGANVSANAAGITAYGSEVTVNGNVNSADDAIYAKDQSKVIVAGDAISTGMHNKMSAGNWNPDTHTYDREWETFSGAGIETDGSANIYVGGNVIGIGTASVGIFKGREDQQNNEPSGKIVIEGTIANSSDNQLRINISNHNSYDETTGQMVTATYATKQELLDSIPEITIYEMDKPFVSVNRTTEDTTVTSEEIYNDVINAINFIIKKSDDVSFADGNENIKTVTAANGKEFKTVNINEAFKMAANVPEGYELSGGDNNNVTVTPNGDGTYTLVLTDIRGGINVTIKAVVRPSEDGNTAEVVVNPTPAYADPNQAPAGAIVVTNTSASAEQAAASAAISGDKPAKMVSFNMSQITPIQYKEAIISNVAAAPQGGALNIQTDRVACFDAKMIAAIKARPDIDVNVVFTYGGKRLKVTIPAGYDVESLLDESGYCGFLRLMSILGSTEI
ncbi:hypothetical protein [Butyrivibrio sp. XPD2006]|uniref:hypothetical protein n=1 Tax=Butyrivibrio sp. XPD2006 TaxID=1280668 RepID=UPI0003B4EB0F|nr:hypothetical protein [Butyrivibrio sp. XPD2006]